MNGKADNQRMRYKKLLRNMLPAGENWLMERILEYAKKHGYAAYTSTLKEAWRLSISGLSASILEGLDSHADLPELTPEEDFTQDPVAMFGIVEARRHRERGVSLNMFLGLMKYYRQSYVDLVHHQCSDSAATEYMELYVNRLFDRIEIGFCGERSGGDGNMAIHELQINNRLMTNEKNKYLTIFESIPTPIIILNEERQVDNMNLAAAKLFNGNQIPGSQYYGFLEENHERANSFCIQGEWAVDFSSLGGVLVSSLHEDLDVFYRDDIEAIAFEKDVAYEGEQLLFRIRLAKNLDVSGKFCGTIIIMENITSFKRALAEIKTLRGLLPICSYCKNVRDDTGFWQKIEAYVSERSEAEFSHSICPDCAKKHFPGIDLYQNGKTDLKET